MSKFRAAIFNCHHRKNGQAMTEFCVSVPLLALLLYAIWYVADMYVMKHETLTAARYGTWMLSRHDVSIDEVRQLIARHFFHNDLDGLEIMEQHEYGGQTAEFINELRQNTTHGPWTNDVIEHLDQSLNSTGEPSIYSLNVRHAFSRTFGPVDLREYAASDYLIQSEHFLSTSWDGGTMSVHDIMDDILSDVVGDILDLLSEEAEE